MPVVKEMEVQVCRMVSETQTVRTPRVVEKRTPVIQSVRVPRTVCLRIPIDECGNPISVGVPVTSSTVTSAPTPAPAQGAPANGKTQNGAKSTNGTNGAAEAPAIKPGENVPMPDPLEE